MFPLVELLKARLSLQLFHDQTIFFDKFVEARRLVDRLDFRRPAKVTYKFKSGSVLMLQGKLDSFISMGVCLRDNRVAHFKPSKDTEGSNIRVFSTSSIDEFMGSHNELAECRLRINLISLDEIHENVQKAMNKECRHQSESSCGCDFLAFSSLTNIDIPKEDQ